MGRWGDIVVCCGPNDHSTDRPKHATITELSLGASRMSERWTRENLYRWTGHYSPLWLAIIPAGLKLYCSAPPAKTQPVGGLAYPQTASISGELIFALLGFWIWAVVTNAHAHRLVRTGGRQSGTQKERGDEFLVVLLLVFFTIAAYILTVRPFIHVPPLYPFIMAVMFPVALLWKPPYD